MLCHCDVTSPAVRTFLIADPSGDLPLLEVLFVDWATGFQSSCWSPRWVGLWDPGHLKATGLLPVLELDAVQERKHLPRGDLVLTLCVLRGNWLRPSI